MTEIETFTTDKPCRCGFTGEGAHPCHSNGYRCRKPSQQRLQAYPTALAGYQMKVGVHVTYACDECWAAHTAKIRAHAQFLAIVDSVPEIDRKPGRDSRHGGLDYDSTQDAWVLVVGQSISQIYTADDRGPTSKHIPALAGLTSSLEDNLKAIEVVYNAVVSEERKKASFHAGS